MNEDNFIKCRDGLDREIFPALIKDKNRIRHFATKFKSDIAIMNLITPDIKKIEQGKDVSELEIFSDEPYNAMMELLYLAFGEKYTKEEIEGFVDVSMVAKIIDIFFGISGYKKKATPLTMSAGESSVPAL